MKTFEFLFLINYIIITTTRSTFYCAIAIVYSSLLNILLKLIQTFILKGLLRWSFKFLCIWYGNSCQKNF